MVNSVIISDNGNITSIPDRAFSNCLNLTTVNLPEGIKEIGAAAFASCYSLAKIHLPDSVTYIGSSAFSSCTSLKSINIPNGVTQINYETFFGCTLKSVEIPESVTVLGYGAFRACGDLTHVTLNEGLTEIRDNVFESCNNLAYINLPDSLNTIGDTVFWNCISLTDIKIPEGVEIIGNEAFMGCSRLENVIFPDSLKEIKSYAFEGCSRLKTLALPNGISTIEDYAFMDCTALEYAYIPSVNVWIGREVFRNHSDNFIIYCSYASTVQEYAEQNNINYAYVGYDKNANDIVWSMDKNGSLYISNDRGEELWCSMGADVVTSASITEVKIGVDTTKLSPKIFAGCNNITSIIIPDSVAYIGDDVLTTGRALTITCSPYSAAFSYAQQNNISCNIVGFAGDINADGNLTSSDASYLLQKVLDSSFETPYENNISKDYMKIGDTNADSSLTAGDASYIIQKVLDSSFEML